MPTIKLPTAVGHLAAYRMGEPRPFPEKAVGPFNRLALAAAHVVADPLADVDPWLDVAIDWDPRSRIASTYGIWGSGWPRPWTRRSAAWGSTGRPRTS